MIKLEDSIRSDLGSFKVDDFITANEGSIYTVISDIENMITTLSETLSIILNGMLDKLKAALSGILSTFEDLAASLFQALTDFVNNQVMSLELRNLINNLLLGLCMGKFNIDLSGLLFSIMLSFAFSLSISICGNDFNFKLSLNTMLSKDGVLVNLRDSFTSDTRAWENGALVQARNLLTGDLNNLLAELNLATRATSDPVIVNILTERDSILANRPGILSTAPVINGDLTGVPIDYSQTGGSNVVENTDYGITDYQWNGADESSFPATNISVSTGTISAGDVSEDLATLRRLELELKDAIDISTDVTISTTVANILAINNQLTDMNMPPENILSILSDIKDREEYIHTIFTNVGTQLASTISSAYNNGEADINTVVFIMSDILDAVGTRITSTVDLNSFIGESTIPLVPVVSVSTLHQEIVVGSNGNTNGTMINVNGIDITDVDSNIIKNTASSSPIISMSSLSENIEEEQYPINIKIAIRLKELISIYYDTETNFIIPKALEEAIGRVNTLVEPSTTVVLTIPPISYIDSIGIKTRSKAC